MKRNTITTLGELQIGDRFTYMKRTDVWQVMKFTSSHVAVNMPILSGFMYMYDEVKRKSIQVRFLRHTIPMPGEECILKDLENGDVFHFPDNPIHEYTMKQPDYVTREWLRHCEMTNGPVFQIMDEKTTVILIRKK